MRFKLILLLLVSFIASPMHQQSIASNTLEAQATQKCSLKNWFLVKYYKNNLRGAVKAGHTEVAKKLINKGAIVNSSSRLKSSPLILATQNKNLKMVKMLLSKGADINALDVREGTALMVAAKKGLTEITQTLLDANANVNIIYRDTFDPTGTHQYTATALSVAAFHGNVEIVKALLNKDANINYITVPFGTPLQTAIENGHIETVKELIKAGVNVNSVDYSGRKALTAAAYTENIEIVNLLLKANATTSAADIDNCPRYIKLIIQEGMQTRKQSDKKVRFKKQHTFILH